MIAAISAAQTPDSDSDSDSDSEGIGIHSSPILEKDDS